MCGMNRDEGNTPTETMDGACDIDRFLRVHSTITACRDLPIETILLECVRTVRDLWPQDEVRARITLDKHDVGDTVIDGDVGVYRSDIVIGGEKRGHIEIGISAGHAAGVENDGVTQRIIDVTTASLARIIDQKQAEQALRESELLMRGLFNSLQAGIVVLTPERTILRVNASLVKMFGYSEKELIGEETEKLHVNTTYYQEFISDRMAGDVFHKGKTVNCEYIMKRKDGTIFPTEHTVSPLGDASGRVIGVISVVRDITERKQVEQALQEACEEMESKVETRTGELMEANTALKVLLKTREKDRETLEENILSNVKELVLPYLEKIKGRKLDDDVATYLHIVESNLNEIISPFSNKLSSRYYNLTPREIQVANLVRDGKTNKEIADVMSVSLRTVGFHRENIRKKLGLQNKKANLRSHLLFYAS